MTSKCGMTVTGTRTRYECFLRQLKAYGLVLYNTLHMVFYTTSTAGDLRATIRRKLQHQSSFETFTEELSTKCVDLNHVIHSTLVPYIHLMGLDLRLDPLSDEHDYVQALWTFTTRLIYEKPALLLPDSLEGSNVTFIQESLQWFIAEQVKTVRPKKPKN